MGDVLMVSSSKQRSGLSALAVKAAKGRAKQYKLADYGDGVDGALLRF
jgi:hypothetical protein